MSAEKTKFFSPLEDEVAILLSTYNGAKYVGELLDSLISQTHENWKVWIRDDGSSDETLKLLDYYKARDKRVNVLVADGDRLGACGSFACLMKYMTNSRYIMFCDQDDVWLPNKIEVTLEAMREAECQYGKDLPLLTHTDLRVVDEDLHVIAPSLKRFVNVTRTTNRPLARLLAQDFVTGCATMINQSLLQASLPVPREAEMHDYWVSLVGAALGRLVFVPRATILYRHHGVNTSGGPRSYRLINNLHRIFTGWHELDQLVTRRLRQSLALEKHLYGKSTVGVQEMLREYHHFARKGGMRAVWGAAEHGIAMQGMARTLIFYLLLTKKGRLASGPVP